MRLSGKVALVTGGARGLGAEQARGLALEGAKVVLADILDQEGRATELEIRGKGGEAQYLRLDVTSEDQWKSVLDRTAELFGSVNILVNNAGLVIPRVPIEDRSLEDWGRILAVNATGIFLGIKHAIPHMRRVGGGSIVNIASIAALGQYSLQEVSYAASKGAVRALTKVAASQYAREGIRCNSIYPGPMDTGMLRTFIPNEEKLAARLSRVPMGRLGNAAEVVAAVIYLSSDESAFTTGCDLVVDGGALTQ